MAISDLKLVIKQMANSGESHFHGLNEKPEEVVKQQLQEEEEGSFSHAMQLSTLTMFSMALQTATELGVFDVIKKAGPEAKLSPNEIAEKLCCKNPESATMLDRVLRLLASYSVVYCDSTVDNNRIYSLAPVAKYFTPNDDGASFAPFLLLQQDKIYLDTWCELKNSIMEGELPFKRAHGGHALDYTQLGTRFNLLYNKGIANISTMVVKKILESYKGFEGINTLVDAGGGFGVTLSMITSKYPRIKCVNFDLPDVVSHAPSYPGVQHVGGDMLESVPKGDAILIKWVFPLWDDESCLKIFKNCYNALPENGKLIVVEEILPTKPNTSASARSVLQVDVVVMMKHPKGKERSEQEFLKLATNAGFSGTRFACFVCNFWIMEFFK